MLVWLKLHRMHDGLQQRPRAVSPFFGRCGVGGCNWCFDGAGGYSHDVLVGGRGRFVFGICDDVK